jgi:hypothetical protein
LAGETEVLAENLPEWKDVDMAYESILPTDTECNFIFIFLRE